MKVKFYYDATSLELPATVFYEIPHMTEELEFFDIKTNSNNMSMKFLLAESADETGTDSEKLRYLIENSYHDITKVEIAKDSGGTLLFSGNIDFDKKLIFSDEKRYIEMKILGILAGVFDTELSIYISNRGGSYFYDGYNASIIENIFNWLVSNSDIRSYSIIAPDVWNQYRPCEASVLDDYPTEVYEHRYRVPWEYYYLEDEQTIALSEVLQQICILGNCGFIVRGTTLIVWIKEPASLVTPGGDLQILERNDLAAEEIDFTIHEDTVFNLLGSDAYNDWLIHISSGMKTDDDLNSIWQDANTNQWKLISVLSGDRLIFEHYPTNPPSVPGYELPNPTSTLIWISGGINHTNIVYDSDSDDDVQHDNSWIDTEIDDFYEDNYYNDQYKEYLITGINNCSGFGSLRASRYFIHESMTLLVKSIKRDLQFIEDTYQPVDIIAIRRIE